MDRSGENYPHVTISRATFKDKLLFLGACTEIPGDQKTRRHFRNLSSESTRAFAVKRKQGKGFQVETTRGLFSLSLSLSLVACGSEQIAIGRSQTTSSVEIPSLAQIPGQTQSRERPRDSYGAMVMVTLTMTIMVRPRKRRRKHRRLESLRQREKMEFPPFQRSLLSKRFVTDP